MRTLIIGGTVFLGRHLVMDLNCSKAIAHGLNFRPLEQTIGHTLRWASNLLEAPAPDGSRAPRDKADMEPGREATLLKEWHEAQQPQSSADAELTSEEVASYS